MFDYHVHTNFSADCDVNIRAIIQSAYDKGLKEIAITDHIDFDYPDKSIVFDLDFINYYEVLTKYQKEFEGKIKVLKGVEVGIQHHIVTECNHALDPYDFDFVICSIHAADKLDLHGGEFFLDKTPKEAYVRYYEYYLECIKDYKDYNVLGHLNLVDRYKKYITGDVAESEYFDIIKEIYSLIISEGKGIEINSSCFRYKMDIYTPTIDMLKLYKEMGGEIITFGSDSHSTETLGYKYEFFMDILKDIGFKYITTFENRKPKFIKI